MTRADIEEKLIEESKCSRNLCKKALDKFNGNSVEALEYLRYKQFMESPLRNKTCIINTTLNEIRKGRDNGFFLSYIANLAGIKFAQLRLGETYSYRVDISNHEYAGIELNMIQDKIGVYLGKKKLDFKVLVADLDNIVFTFMEAPEYMKYHV